MFSRPIGGIVFGHLGDVLGRRFVLVTTLVIMGVTTALMGLLPGYASWGDLEPTAAGDVALYSGHCAGRRMGWCGTVVDGTR